MLGIHRGQLLATLGLPDKLPLAHAGRYTNTPVYHFKAEFPYRCWDGELGRYEDVIAHTGPFAHLTIVIKAVDKVLLDTTGRSKSSAHRIFVECACGRLIPAGRYHQHKPSCKAVE